MNSRQMDDTIEYIGAFSRKTGQSKVKITFHGGEPLTAGHKIIRQALAGLSSMFGGNNIDFAVQSNLWLLDDEFCEMFDRFDVQLGTSLDGPEKITDSQRGKNYFSNTMKGISLAREHGLKVSCIATFTSKTLEYWQEVLDFFIRQHLNLSIHPSVPTLTKNLASQTLNPRQYEKLLPDLLDYYIPRRREIAINSLDYACKSVMMGESKVCTFRDCLGDFLVIDPKGNIYPCQRLVGLEHFRLGTIKRDSNPYKLFNSPAARHMKEREEQVRQTCSSCRHFEYCKGGCTYNAWADPMGNKVKDPYCRAYSHLFDTISQGFSREMEADENIDAIVREPVPGIGSGLGNMLMRKGSLIELAQTGPHPSLTVRSARRVIAAVELARNPHFPTAAAHLVKMGVCRNQQTAEASLHKLKRSIQPVFNRLNRIYIHVTFRCQLNCTHCYAQADGGGKNQPDMEVDAVIKLIKQAKELKFNQVTITGGEPLQHRCRHRLLDALAKARQWAYPMILTLRTNFAVPLNSYEIKKLGAAVHQIVVSVDGNRLRHDDRRGQGSFNLTLQNLEMYVELKANNREMGELILAGVMPLEEARGIAGESVRQLALDLGIKRTRFKPLLPIGRALNLQPVPEPESPTAFATPMEIIRQDFQPLYTCGIGQNLYVDSSGRSFPCYAYRKPHAFLGNVLEKDLETVISSQFFLELSRHTVDTNPRCSLCTLRYLCGGACRAWGGEAAQYNLDSPPPDCRNLEKQAQELYATACEYLGISGKSEKIPGPPKEKQKETIYHEV